ncbi:antitoxin [Kribbella sp. CA-294648]|uniref:antitoxin n=1 Tax=Kribbella sp. CA-294648 TaxID=3239948 RepID=UPI003D949558
MTDFQEQAKNWLRNVVNQNPDKIKAGVEKAGDLIDKQTGGKYAEKVDAVQQKVGSYVDNQAGSSQSAQPSDSPGATGQEPPAGQESQAGRRNHQPDLKTVRRMPRRRLVRPARKQLTATPLQAEQRSMRPTRPL